jgi:hypothetical protein
MLIVGDAKLENGILHDSGKNETGRDSTRQVSCQI